MKREPLILVQDFKKQFGDKVVHDGVSFEVFKGECVGLVGGSGAGKSVFLRCLIGLEKPDSGLVLFKNQDVTLLNENELVEVRKKIAYVFQGGALFDSMTVFENLAYPLREHTQMSEQEIEAKVSEQLADFGLSHTTHLLPSELSGGMQKRIGLARGIILGPEVILYDEPTAGLDPSNTKNIQSLILRSKKKGVTSILVTHDMPTAFAVCDRICLLKKGRIVESGTIAELEKKSTGPIADYVHGEEEVL